MSKTKITAKRTKKAKRKPRRIFFAKKYCGRCERTRSPRFFHRNAARATGLADWCKDCLGEWREERVG